MSESSFRLGGYLKIPDIDGESKRADHEGEIDAHRVSWKIAQRNSSALGSGRSSARAEIGPIFVDKWTDAASPYLALACMQAKSFDEVVLMFRKDSGDAHLDYLKITMTNVIISSFEMLNEYKEEEEPILMIPERIGLSCEKINIVYTVQADDHSAGDEHEVEYDVGKGA